MADIILNQGQKNAFNLINEFINQDTDKYFLLQGEAGSGKSFLIRKLIYELVDKKFKYKILSPTNKALDILTDFMPEYKNNILTLARYNSYKQVITDEGLKVSKYDLKNKIEEIIFVDESSMINTDVFDCIERQDCKFIFIADIKQLAPVGEELSKIYKIDFKENTYKLLENERQKNAEMSLSTFINNVRKNGDNENYRLESNEKYTTNDKNDFVEKALESFNTDDDTIILCYTNSRCNSYNNQIRSLMFNKSNDELVKFYLGEDVVFSASTFINKQNYSSGKKYRITHLKVVEKFLNNTLCLCKNKNKIEFISKTLIETKIEKCLKCHTSTSMKQCKSIKFFEIRLDDNSEYIYKPIDEEENEKFKSIMKKHKDRSISSKNAYIWKQYYGFEDLYNAPISYKYSITIHRAQGSGYRNVFVDCVNINYCQDSKLKNQLIYTAVSRSSNNLLCLI